MNNTRFVKPNKGLVVRDPATGEPLPETGAQVPDTTYWRRRLQDEDVIPAKPTKQEKGGNK